MLIACVRLIKLICLLTCMWLGRPSYHSFPYSDGDYVLSCYPYKWCSRVFQSRVFSPPPRPHHVIYASAHAKDFNRLIETWWVSIAYNLHFTSDSHVERCMISVSICVYWACSISIYSQSDSLDMFQFTKFHQIRTVTPATELCTVKNYSYGIRPPSWI